MKLWLNARVAVVLMVFAIALLGVVSGGENELPSRYAVVVDAGSTGTRAFVFEEIHSVNGTPTIRSYSCGKERVGLSTFASDRSALEQLFTNLLTTAISIIPAQYHATTVVHVRGTAGMRLLDSQDQDALWDATVLSLKNRPDIPFHIDRNNFGTITGHQEAFYAVLASNYIVGSIDRELRVLPGGTLIGALDMGGSSNQLVIYNGSDPTLKVESSHFWSHSWLRYGAELIRERILQHIYETHVGEQAATPINSAATASADTEVVYLANPCGFANYMDAYTGLYVLNGTGATQECLALIERIVWADSAPITDTEGQLVHDTITEEGVADLTMGAETPAGGLPPLQNFCLAGPCPIEQVTHPSVLGHEFYAMSVYYYALDCVRELGPEPLPHWPTPTLAELRAATEQFCMLPWGELKARYDAQQGHEWTYPSQLPYRCLEALYIVTLLEKGFGFSPHMRNITFALEVKGQEVEWTLGYVLAEVDFEAAHRVDAGELDEWLPHGATNFSPQDEHSRAEISRRELLLYLELANKAIVLLEQSAKHVVDRVRLWRSKYEGLLEQYQHRQWW